MRAGFPERAVRLLGEQEVLRCHDWPLLELAEKGYMYMSGESLGKYTEQLLGEKHLQVREAHLAPLPTSLLLEWNDKNLIS